MTQSVANDKVDAAARKLCESVPLNRDATVKFVVFPAACDGPNCDCWTHIKAATRAIINNLTSADIGSDRQ